MRASSPSIILSDHIRVDGVAQSYGDRRVLEGVDLAVGARARIGLIGENGVGKSTLLRIIAGEESPDEGTIARPNRTGLLWQEVPFTPTDTIGDVFEAALA
ncbi:ATP-binding cassette domain-containing protein, partial [Rhizobium johnstonii]|uniref:ATP-binding cassette domain-containing protein n=1 Tax=Rhizobium johnstonii TaxID=3019933 RepID=UPI003F9B57EE